MPNMQPVVLTDRQSTPVEHTFVPNGQVASGVYSMRESSGIPINDNTITLSLHETPTRYKPRIKLSVPVVGDSNALTIDGSAPSVLVRTARVNIEFDFDKASTTEERNDVVGMIQDALSADQTLLNGLIVGLEDVY